MDNTHQSCMKNQKSLKYLALGDSYTIGEGVAPEETYPYLLVQKLNQYNLHFSEPKVIAQTGWTSGELIHAISSEHLEGQLFDLVTLLIGVNNQYRGQSLEAYESDFKKLLEFSLSMVNDQSHRVAVISIPDWAVTAFGHSGTRNPEDIAQEIDAFNIINRNISSERSVNYLEITSQYRKVGGMQENMAGDGLHPSGKIYASWADDLSKVVFSNFYKKNTR